MRDEKIAALDSGNSPSALAPFENKPQDDAQTTLLPLFISAKAGGGIKNGSPLKEKKYFGKFVLMVFVTSCVVVLFSAIISKTRQERISLLESRKILEKQSVRLEAENSRLAHEYDALKSDPVRIEKEARNRFGYMGTEEVAYPRYDFRVTSAIPKETENATPKNPWVAFLFDGAFPWQVPALIILISSAYYLVSYHYEYRKLRQPGC